MDTLTVTIVCLALTAAVILDLRSQRIPNALTLPFALAAMATHLLNQGLVGLWFSLCGFGLGLALMLAPFLFGVMGGGDVKLMAAVGAWIGPRMLLAAFLFTCIAGGLYALLVLATRRDALREVFQRFLAALYATAGTGEFHYQPRQSEGLPRLCYGLAIALGTVAAMLRPVLTAGLG